MICNGGIGEEGGFGIWCSIFVGCVDRVFELVFAVVVVVVSDVVVPSVFVVFVADGVLTPEEARA